jgi:demethylmenaquinone methyltransferase/2-methoxy-6-polyprenyl-1,4-benzoquinol methylase
MIDHFKVIAPFYEKVFPMNYADEIVKRAGLPVDGLLLDAGGGTGRVSKAVSDRVSKVVLLDVSLDMLSQGKNHHNLLLVNSTTETIPFAINQFEVILLIDAFHHVLSQEKTLSELWRVLQPGGKLIIIEPDIKLFAVKLVALFEKVMLMRSHFRKPEDIQKMAQNLNGSRVSLVREQFNAWVIVEKLKI